MAFTRSFRLTAAAAVAASVALLGAASWQAHATVSLDGVTPFVNGGREVRDNAQNPGAVVMTNKGRQFCSGVRIGPTWVITARHCVDGPNNDMKLVIDDVYTAEVKALTGPKSRVKQVHRAPTADTVLLELEQATPGPIAGYSSTFAEGDQVTMWGWGRTNGTTMGPLSDWLKVARGSIRTAKGTAQYYGGHNIVLRGEDGITAPGDSGGPVLNPQGQAIANVSWGMSQIGGPWKMNIAGMSSFDQNIGWIQQTTGVAPGGQRYWYTGK